ncbi:MAG: Druantia anti-phage system protein DruA [Candidatus Thermoplasmatota archaeon]
MRWAPSSNETVYDEGSYLGDVLDPANAADFIPFIPELNGDDRARLRLLSEGLSSCTTSAQRVQRVREALQATDGRAYRLKAALSVLLDLMRHEYCVRLRGGTLEVAATTLSSWQGSPAEYKQFQRRHLLQERDQQLTEDSVRRFIAKMETPRRHGRRSVTIHNLIGDGRAILRALSDAPAHPAGLFEKLPIQPYVQEVRTGECDSETGFALQDIWRYFRHTWTLPYNSTPGRNMQFLVRDAAQPFHPVMGILGLGSSVIQITPRDDRLGWTIAAVLERFAPALGLPASAADPTMPDRDDIARFLASMRSSLETAREETSHVGISHHNAKPTAELVERLHQLADEFSDLEYELGTSREHRSFRDERDTTLFRKKRAKAIYRVVRAQLLFDSLSGNPEDQLRLLLTTRDGRHALAVALQEQKKRHVGSSIIDLVVCGAVAPYSQLLGGKLVAMLATSPTVVHAYRRRYQEAHSHIASAMKGAAVTRPAELVFMGTTSLYETHSSQYERIRLPDELGGLRFEAIGKTEGFASVQFSPETRALLEGVTKRVRGRRFVTHKFGEGVNPKLRAIGMGLTDIGLDGRLLKYSSRRLVYGVTLAENTREYLLGMEPKPRYGWRGRSARDVERAIAAHWVSRWALPRSLREAVVSALALPARETISMSLRPHRPEVTLDVFERSHPVPLTTAPRIR